jgi:hypothetical protein
METIIELLKMLLSTQVIFGGLILYFLLTYKSNLKKLFSSISTIKLPGGTELSTQQLNREEDKKEVILDKNPDIDSYDKKKLQELYNTERARAYLWEYNYLNFFLVRNSQNILDWFYALDKGTSYSLYDSTWLNAVPNPNEREIIFNVLINHHLIIKNKEIIHISEKGKEYVEWRGELTSIEEK